MKIGKHATLPVVEIGLDALILEDGDERIPLPNKAVPRGVSVGDRIEVFIYTDREGAPVATLQEPYAEADEFAVLKVKEVGTQGAFLDWGLDKDLLLPHSTQAVKIKRAGGQLVVRVYCDPVSKRMVASSKLRKFLDEPPRDLEPGQRVELLFYEATDLGVNAIVDGLFTGLLHRAAGEASPRPGDRRSGFIEKLRPDGRVDLTLHRGKAAERRSDAEDAILAALRKAGGQLPLGDKSDPGEIQDALGLSKKAFRKALGGLLRARRIQLSDREVRLATGGIKSSRSRD